LVCSIYINLQCADGSFYLRPYHLSLRPNQQAGYILSRPCMYFLTLVKQASSVPGTNTVPHSPCTAVKWVPLSHTLFLASYADGTMVVYDRDREDGPFTPREPHGPSAMPSPLPSPAGPRSNGSLGGSNGHLLQEARWDPLYDMFVTSNQVTGNEKSLKNPVSHWRVSKKRISGMVTLHSPSLPSSLSWNTSLTQNAR